MIQEKIPDSIYKPFEIKDGKVIYLCQKCRGERESKDNLFCKRCSMMADYNRLPYWYGT